METYKITGTTNGYIANRDIHFNGRTSYNLETGLSFEQAQKKLEEFFKDDYPNANFFSTEEEYVFDLCYGKIEEQAECSGMKIEDYFQITKKRWFIYYTHSFNSRQKFEGAGYYDCQYWGCIFKKGSQFYDYDSRAYGIHNETEE